MKKTIAEIVGDIEKIDQVLKKFNDMEGDHIYVAEDLLRDYRDMLMRQTVNI